MPFGEMPCASSPRGNLRRFAQQRGLEKGLVRPESRTAAKNKETIVGHSPLYCHRAASKTDNAAEIDGQRSLDCAATAQQNAPHFPCAAAAHRTLSDWGKSTSRASIEIDFSIADYDALSAKAACALGKRF